MTRLVSRRALLFAAAGLTTAPLWARASHAADWRPTEVVRIVVPAAPGGSTDIIGRYLAQHLQAAWGQTAVVENKSGGGGTIGTTDYVRQKPDGHTILMADVGTLTINTHVRYSGRTSPVLTSFSSFAASTLMNALKSCGEPPAISSPC